MMRSPCSPTAIPRRCAARSRTPASPTCASGSSSASRRGPRPASSSAARRRAHRSRDRSPRSPRPPARRSWPRSPARCVTTRTTTASSSRSRPTWRRGGRDARGAPRLPGHGHPQPGLRGLSRARGTRARGTGRGRRAGGDRTLRGAGDTARGRRPTPGRPSSSASPALGSPLETGPLTARFTFEPNPAAPGDTIRLDASGSTASREARDRRLRLGARRRRGRAGRLRARRRRGARAGDRPRAPTGRHGPAPDRPARAGLRRGNGRDLPRARLHGRPGREHRVRLRADPGERRPGRPLRSGGGRRLHVQLGLRGRRRVHPAHARALRVAHVRDARRAPCDAAGHGMPPARRGSARGRSPSSRRAPT